VPTLRGLLFGPKLVITTRILTFKILTNAGTLAPRVAKWLPKFNCILYLALGEYKAIKFSIYY